MSDERTPLGRLFDEVTEANGWSLREVERRIERRDLKLKRSRISEMRHEWPLETITASTIYALAAGLGISPARVALAAVQSMGFPIADAAISPAEAIMRDESLTEDTKNALLAILRGANERRRGA